MYRRTEVPAILSWVLVPVGHWSVLEEEVLLGRLAGSWRAPSLCVRSTLPERFDDMDSLKKPDFNLFRCSFLWQGCTTSGKYLMVILILPAAKTILITNNPNISEAFSSLLLLQNSPWAAASLTETMSTEIFPWRLQSDAVFWIYTCVNSSFLIPQSNYID